MKISEPKITTVENIRKSVMISLFLQTKCVKKFTTREKNDAICCIQVYNEDF